MTFRDKLIAMIGATLLILSGCSPAPETVHRKLHAEQGTYVADISNNGKFSVVSTNSNGILLWPRYANNAKYNWRHDDQTSQIVAVDISDDGSMVATATRYEFALWNTDSGENLGFWKIANGGIQDIAVSNNASTIVLAKRNGTQIAFNPQTGRRLEFYGHSERINAINISANGFYVLSGSNDKTAILWDTRSGQIVHQWEHKNRVTQVALHSQGDYAFTAGSTDNARIWKLPEGTEVSRLKFIDRQRIFSSARFSRDGSLLITGSPSRRINLWDSQTGESLRHWNVDLVDERNANSAVVLAVHFYDNENIVFSESSSGLAEWWQLAPNWNQ